MTSWGTFVRKPCREEQLRRRLAEYAISLRSWPTSRVASAAVRVAATRECRIYVIVLTVESEVEVGGIVADAVTNKLTIVMQHIIHVTHLTLVWPLFGGAVPMGFRKPLTAAHGRELLQLETARQGTWA